MDRAHAEIEVRSLLDGLLTNLDVFVRNEQRRVESRWLNTKSLGSHVAQILKVGAVLSSQGTVQEIQSAHTLEGWAAFTELLSKRSKLISGFLDNLRVKGKRTQNCLCRELGCLGAGEHKVNHFVDDVFLLENIRDAQEK